MRKHLCFLLGLLCLSAIAMAQNVTLTGRVTDAKDGTALSGVSVTSKRTRSGAKTDVKGDFSITVPSGNTTLVFSFVGFATQEVNVGGSTNLDVKLIASDAASLNEVVVVGYGVQQKKAFTGSASKVDVKEFTNLSTPSVDKQLAGRAAGVQVTNAGGGVNTPARIRIRGIQSISSNNDPLIVVDGIPIVQGDLAAVGHSNSLGDINPSDIETLDVLKDGSATAIYGSRAAGGVILITTKRGTKGKARVTYETTLGYTSPLKKFALLNAKEFELIANEKTDQRRPGYTCRYQCRSRYISYRLAGGRYEQQGICTKP